MTTFGQIRDLNFLANFVVLILNVHKLRQFLEVWIFKKSYDFVKIAVWLSEIYDINLNDFDMVLKTSINVGRKLTYSLLGFWFSFFFPDW